MPIRWAAGMSTDAANWGDNPIIVIEMGFAGNSTAVYGVNAGTGIHPHLASFKDAGILLQQALRGNDRRTALIVEAPLSYFWADGAAAPRSRIRPDGPPLEERRAWKYKRKTSQWIRKETEQRLWYVGAGASTALGAVLMLHELDCREAGSSRRKPIHLFEGFASFKNCRFTQEKPEGPPSIPTHGEEAVRLAEQFRTAQDPVPPECVQATSILDLLAQSESAHGLALPAVIDLYPGERPTNQV